MRISSEAIPRDHKSRRKYYRRRELFRVQGGLCFWCAEAMSLDRLVPNIHGRLKHNQRYASFEHIKPRSSGGGGHMHNLVLAHVGCNNRRPRKKWPHDPVYGTGAPPIIAFDWSEVETRQARERAAGQLAQGRLPSFQATPVAPDPEKRT